MKSHWLYNGNILEEPPSGAFGFIYLITNCTNNKKYIGRKYIISTTRKPLTKKQINSGRVRKTVVKKESNWKTYTGSNLALNNDISVLGKDNFKFEILAFGNTKGQVNYLENYYQYISHCLLKTDYYNSAIGNKDFSALASNQILFEQIITNNEKIKNIL